MASEYEQVGKVLLAGVPSDVSSRVRGALAGAKVVIATARDGTQAHELIVREQYDAVIAGYPLPDGPLSQFLDGVRKTGGPNRGAAVVVLTPEVFKTEAEDYVGRGANAVVSAKSLEAELPGVLERLFHVAPRLVARIPSRVEVVGGRFAKRVFCQTVNLSSSGMLLRLPPTDQPGTEVAFELLFPGDLQPVRGRARVVRHTLDKRERLSGMGVTFCGFSNGDERRLLSHLHRLTA
jgi:CheY-like chemotaxis protein